MKNKEGTIAIPLVLSGLTLSENELKAPFFVTANKMADFKELNEKRLTENHPERFSSVRERGGREQSARKAAEVSLTGSRPVGEPLPGFKKKNNTKSLKAERSYFFFLFRKRGRDGEGARERKPEKRG